MKHLKDTLINNRNKDVKVSSKKEKIDDNNSLLSSFSSSFSSSISFTCDTVKEIFNKEKYKSFGKRFSIKEKKPKKKLSLTPEDFFKDIFLKNSMVNDYCQAKENKQSRMFKNMKLLGIFRRNKLPDNQQIKEISKEEKRLNFIEDSKIIGDKLIGKNQSKRNVDKEFEKYCGNITLRKSNEIGEFDDVSIKEVLSPQETPRSRRRKNEFYYKNDSVQLKDVPFIQSCRYDMRSSINNQLLYTKAKYKRPSRSMSTGNWKSLSTIHEDYEQVLMRHPTSDEEDDSDSDYFDDYIELGGSQIHYFDML
ncbi:Hypothetical protein SRAE_2000437300 [Strongyloides ratti]|uniref:Uncharacterized protein n=1 Tax=Strongyloides ratti TaxID=34506 RepID=A0A090LQA6_STRRB|nr:Hypothetical protein SRAE_2000437300 [Strongyloides ratti]CEF69726.1 Hypothetical protein SRAE_2000437300 [Strongyloides ratti]